MILKKTMGEKKFKKGEWVGAESITTILFTHLNRYTHLASDLFSYQVIYSIGKKSYTLKN